MVSFNYDTRPGYEFRCQVTFQFREVLECCLQLFFEDIKVRNKLRALHNGLVEDEEALREYKRILKPTYEMIRVISGL